MTYPEHRAAIAREDSKPCPRCGGDKLRPDYTRSSYCHAQRDRRSIQQDHDQPVT